MILRISTDERLQRDTFGMQPDTYFSAAIAHAYYCIFYCAKAYLLTKGVRTRPPEEHKKTYGGFARFVKRGVVDAELLRLYEETMVRADTLLMIFGKEKRKRGEFTYRKLPQANRGPAEESVRNAQTFYRHIVNVVRETA